MTIKFHPSLGKNYKIMKKKKKNLVNMHMACQYLWIVIHLFDRVRLGPVHRSTGPLGFCHVSSFVQVFVHVTASQRVQYYCTLDRSHSLFDKGVLSYIIGAS